MTTSFTCTSTGDDRTAVIRPAGELDMVTVDELWLHLAYHLEPSVLVILDCSGITFCGAAAVHAVERADHAARQIGGAFVLAAVGEPLATVLDLTGLTGRFTTTPTVAEAVARSRRPRDRRERHW